MIGLSLSLTRAGVPRAFAELNFLSATLDQRITFTRASTKTYVGSDGLRHTAAANECPLEYDPVSLLPIGRSFWEARTNLLLNSDAPATQNIAVTAQTYTLSFEGSGTVVLSGAYSGSKAGTGSGPANRVSLTFTAAVGTLTVTPSGGVQNFQLEAAATPGPYIPTQGAQVTRAADVATVNDLTTLRFKAAQFSVYIEALGGAQVSDSHNPRYWNLSDGTNNNRIGVLKTSDVPIFQLYALDAGSGLGISIATSPSAHGLDKIAASFANGAADISANGVGTSGTIPTPAGISRLEIGYFSYPGQWLNSPIRKLRIYPRALTAAELQALTA